MIQLWTILGQSGEVLCPAFETPSYGSHPKDNGWAWDAETQTATRIEMFADPVVQKFAGGEWSVDIAVLRARRWQEAKERRDRAEWSGCAAPLGRVDTDPDSQRKISGAVQLAMIAQSAGQPFSIDWTMQDNSSVVHDALAMVGLGMAVGQHVAACHEAALLRRAAIQAANTPEDLDAVDLEGDWPGA